MFITKKHIPRRTFLRGVGVTVAVPLLDAMVPAHTALARTAARPVPRFAGIWHPHGASPGYWSPLQTGRDFEFSFITKPLERFRERTVLISGLDCTAAYSTVDEPGGNHARGAVFLSGARPKRDAVTPNLDVTIDQTIAERWGRETLLSSIQLGIEDPSGNSGNCNWGYSCAYTNSVSWSTPTTPLPTEINPRMAFERMFGDGASPEERRAGRLQTVSVLDSVTHELTHFKKDLGAGDRTRLDDYLENIRELERRIRIATSNPEVELSGEVPFGIPERQGRPLQADVRPDGDGVPGRHHPLGHPHARSRPLREQLPRVGVRGRVARDVAPRRHSRQQGELRQGEPVPRARTSRTSARSCGTCPTGTARCWTTC